MPYPLCRHIKTNGLQCKAPALTEGVYCFFHDRLYARHSAFRYTPATRGYLVPGQHVQLEPLEDAESVQVALSVVINALATGQLEPRRASALLYGLSLASANTRRLKFRSLPSEIVRAMETTDEGANLAIAGGTVDV